MNANDVARHLETISRLQSDDEQAHACEDGLYIAVLQHVAEHSTDEKCKYLANLALEARKFEFARWYA